MRDDDTQVLASPELRVRYDAKVVQMQADGMQVLASPKMRKRYDAKGAEGVDVDFMDHAEFFNALFGSDRFEHLVGALMIAAAARHGDLNSEQMKRMQVGA